MMFFLFPHLTDESIIFFIELNLGFQFSFFCNLLQLATMNGRSPGLFCLNTKSNLYLFFTIETMS